MRRIVLWMSISLDGYIEGPDHDISWHRVDEELHLHLNEVAASMGGEINGRVIYELMAAYWPTADEDPEASPATVEFAKIWRETPKIVYSRTLEEAGWNSTIVREIDPAHVEALKAEEGGDLSLGGANLGAEFLRRGLVDELRIYLHPVTIGRGTPLFPDDVSLDLRTIETRTFGNGVVLLRYEIV